MAGTTTAAPASDEDLAFRIAQRDESPRACREAREACAELFARHGLRLLAFLAARVPRSERDDVHQEIWVRVWERLPRSFHGGNFKAWLYQVARNYLIDRGRRRRADALEDDVEPEAAASMRPDVILVEAELREALERCMASLRSDVAALVRARLGGESYDEVCQRLGLRVERAHRLYHQAKEQLRQCVARATS